jgi:glycerol uptake facilitator-like aquaporin
MRPTRILVAELIGTTVLMLGGPGTAILATGASSRTAASACSGWRWPSGSRCW